MRAQWLSVIAFALSLLAVPATAQDELGTVAEVRPEASGGFGADRLTLIRGSQLREGETIITGSNGEVQIVFSDETHLVIGRGSRLVIERYLMRGGGASQKFAVNALAGTFRFITGKGDKNAYSIATPTGTLGVRGTEFDFTVAPVTGLTSVILFEGGVELCPTSGECVVLSRRCEVAQLTSKRDARLLQRETDRQKVASTIFPYVASQARLLREFRVDRPARCAAPVQTAQGRPARVPANTLDPPPPPPPPPIVDEEKPHKPEGNNGLGNGGEGDEGDHEQGNPGHGGDKGKDKPKDKDHNKKNH